MSIILRCPQHMKNVHGHWEPNIEWLDAKLGIPSAAGFHRILTPTGKLSRSRERYMGELLAEWALGEQWDTGIGNSHWVLRGIELEPQARLWYEMAYSEVEEVGFIWRDESKLAGCSPDALVGDAGLLELKCPSPAWHMLYLSSPGQLARQYHWQVQGQLWASGRAWCDIMSFCPGLPEVVERVRPEGIAALEKNIPVFVAEMLERREQLRKMGVGPEEE